MNATHINNMHTLNIKSSLPTATSTFSLIVVVMHIYTIHTNQSQHAAHAIEFPREY